MSKSQETLQSKPDYSFNETIYQSGDKKLSVSDMIPQQELKPGINSKNY